MSDRPILFSAPMIRALLDGRKTQTRRVLRMQPPEWAVCCEQPLMYNALHQWVPSGLWRWCEELQDPPRPLRSWPVDDDGQHYWLRAPIAKGDRLWVREAWRCNGWASDLATIFYRASEGDGYTAMCEQYPVAGKQPLRVTGSWRPSIHMPRWASRLTLYVTDVRVQRLQDISEADAIAEGVEKDHAAGMSSVWGWRDYLRGNDIAKRHFADPCESYRTLWNSINGPGAWEANPWVTAYTFEARRGNVDSLPVCLSEASA